MTTPHDALCPRADIGYLPNVACWCDEIAKVRADEREAVATRLDAMRPFEGPRAQRVISACAAYARDPHLAALDRLIAQEAR